MPPEMLKKREDLSLSIRGAMDCWATSGEGTFTSLIVATKGRKRLSIGGDVPAPIASLRLRPQLRVAREDRLDILLGDGNDLALAAIEQEFRAHQNASRLSSVSVNTSLAAGV
jgi:hypothetical protein